MNGSAVTQMEQPQYVDLEQQYYAKMKSAAEQMYKYFNSQTQKQPNIMSEFRPREHNGKVKEKTICKHNTKFILTKLL